MAEMALPWHRTHPAVAPAKDKQGQSVADVVDQLRQLTSRLSSEVDRLEHVNDAAQRSAEKGQQ